MQPATEQQSPEKAWLAFRAEYAGHQAERRERILVLLIVDDKLSVQSRAALSVPIFPVPASVRGLGVGIRAGLRN